MGLIEIFVLHLVLSFLLVKEVAYIAYYNKKLTGKLFYAHAYQQSIIAILKKQGLKNFENFPE